MRITSGLFDRMVLQRNRRGLSDALILGTCKSDGPVIARVLRSNKAVRGIASTRTGLANKGRFTARLRGIPTGGPYSIELRVGDESIVAKDVLVGDVWIVGGQSNMQGCGRRAGALKGQRMVRAFYMHDRWDVAADPIHNLWNAVDPVHGGNPDGRDSGEGGVGPAVSFGQSMFKHTNIPQGLIACAHGGTSMIQWNPALKKQGGRSFYGATIRRFKKNGSKVAGVIWYQGESEADPAAAAHYTQKMKKLIAAMRRDMHDPRLPFVGVQISRVVAEMGWVGWNSVQEQQRRLPDLVDRCLFVPAIDLGLSDLIHIDSAGSQVLGKRLAEAMLRLHEGRRAGRMPIELKHVSVRRGYKGLGEVVLTFNHVAGSLRAPLRAVGFDIVNATGKTCFSPHAAHVENNQVILETVWPIICVAESFVHHGHGLDPACNVIDEDGWPLPVFGPIRVAPPRAVSGFVREMSGRQLISAGNIRTIPYPGRRNGKAWSILKSEFDFLNVNLEFVENPKGTTKYFRHHFRCGEPMRLAVLLGYDGPVKLWINGKERFVDARGKNPAIPDDKSIPFKGTKGKHEIVVALGSHNGQACGIYLRFERLDVSTKSLEKGDHVALPELIC